jgi:hypothetical protein
MQKCLQIAVSGRVDRTLAFQELCGDPGGLDNERTMGDGDGGRTSDEAAIWSAQRLDKARARGRAPHPRKPRHPSPANYAQLKRARALLHVETRDDTDRVAGAAIGHHETRGPQVPARRQRSRRSAASAPRRSRQLRDRGLQRTGAGGDVQPPRPGRTTRWCLAAVGSLGHVRSLIRKKAQPRGRLLRGPGHTPPMANFRRPPNP